MGNIKEVKKIIESNRITYQYGNPPEPFGGITDEGVELSAKLIDDYYCQLFPQPLDGELLLTPEEMAEVLHSTPKTKLKFESKLTAKDMVAFKDEMKIELRAVAAASTDKALALLPPKIEEARRQERERIMKEGGACGAVSRQGIDCMKMWNFWQALKGGE
ncbi:MAG: hypothetical protein KAY32_15475 [Candidatus Eisenbacteria sp.]|nr:hypothetical protein [Candidatus Eisenbacteria bacterium]